MKEGGIRICRCGSSPYIVKGEGELEELEEKSPKFSLSKVPLSIIPAVAFFVQKRNPLDLRQPSGDLCQQQVLEA